MKKIFLITFFLLYPSFAFAQIPAFPMSFWGTVTIDGNSAPVGTTIRAYYGSTKAGEVTIEEAGIYGYTEPTRQKLVLGEGSSAISFTFQRSGEAETAGISPVTHTEFISGDTVEKNLAFITETETETPPAETPSRPRGGGGGSSRSSGQVLGTQTGSGLTETQIQAVLDLIRAFGADVSTLASAEGALRGNTSSGTTGFTFTRDLKLGSIGEDVRMLQKLLNTRGHTVAASGPGSSGNETTSFGPATRAALIRFQQAKGIVPASGYFGPKTRAAVQ